MTPKASSCLVLYTSFLNLIPNKATDIGRVTNNDDYFDRIQGEEEERKEVNRIYLNSSVNSFVAASSRVQLHEEGKFYRVRLYDSWE